MLTKHKPHSQYQYMKYWDQNEKYCRTGYGCLVEYHLFRLPRRVGLEPMHPQNNGKD
jgi:hypothetical protein